MVTYTIISRYDELGDLDSLNTDLEKPELIIKRDNPLYDPTEILTKLDDPSFKLYTATDKSRKQLNFQLNINIPGDLSKLKSYIRLALTEGRYLNSQWCHTKGIAWAACDSYVFKHSEYNEYSYSLNTCDIYLKIALNKKGQALLIISAHLGTY